MSIPTIFLNNGLTIPVMVAPMVGISHAAFRSWVRSFVPPQVKFLIFTEMLSTRRLPSERLDSSNELKVTKEESTGESAYVPQLLGNEELFIGPSVKKLSTLNPWGFDINMGCPQSHILRHNWGVRLVGDPEYASAVVSMVRRHTTRPVSVKLRGGADKETPLEYLIKFTDGLEKAGLDWLTIHPRPRSASQHQGLANWKVASELKKYRSIPVVVNGDLQTADDVLHVLGDLNCDGAMIARSATIRPWILWQVAHRLNPDQVPATWNDLKLPTDSYEEGKLYFKAYLSFIRILKETFGCNEYSIQKARFLAATGSKWFLFGHSFWRITMKSKSLDEMSERVSEYADKFSGEMYGRIDL